jgi:hypothetical protein
MTKLMKNDMLNITIIIVIIMTRPHLLGHGDRLPEDVAVDLEAPRLLAHVEAHLLAQAAHEPRMIDLSVLISPARHACHYWCTPLRNLNHQEAGMGARLVDGHKSSHPST